uniref:Uncharacterized protein n=1 Tax=Globisporangium ultimum (strain ATCC 200006 / CBS 805.95 / DAOM BR144) TaxID=431595 RepID=K3XA78_GLOUD
MPVYLLGEHFVLQERDRIRFSPAAKYYDNVFAVISIIVELVQLNSLSFDPTIEWNKSDQIPKLMQWLGSLGITQIGIAQIELKAALYILALVVWFLMLKSANKFQESSPKLNHLFTKDLPLLLNGFLYMSTITTFFSFLSCIDCKGKYGELFDKCINSDMDDPPFLLSHQSITCWSQEHQKYAFLGVWGITFFLPVGLLSHGMNQVLFQQEKLDIKYAAVIVLFSQLVKALTATAKAFFTFNSLVLACIGLAGNGVLLLLMSCMKSSSLWFIKLIKSGIYAASCWSSMCAIYQIRKGVMSSMSLIYIGWLTIAAVTMSAVLLVLRRQADRKQKEDQGHWAMHQALMASTNVSEVAVSFTDAEQKFLDIAKKRAATPSSQAAIFVNKAHQLNVDNPPAELEHFMRQARAMANSKSFENNQNAALGVAFMKNARILAKKVDSSEGLRLRKHPNT